MADPYSAHERSESSDLDSDEIPLYVRGATSSDVGYLFVGVHEMRTRQKLVSCVAVAALGVVVLPGVASATTQTGTLGNGCRMTGGNVQYGGVVSAATTPRSNCLTVQVKLWTSVGFYSKGYTPVPNNTSLQVSPNSGTLTYSDHNATGDNNPQAQGIRLYP